LYHVIHLPFTGPDSNAAADTPTPLAADNCSALAANASTLDMASQIQAIAAAVTAALAVQQQQQQQQQIQEQQQLTAQLLQHILHQQLLSTFSPSPASSNSTALNQSGGGSKSTLSSREKGDKKRTIDLSVSCRSACHVLSRLVSG
jgi:negative regulator of sigma E activity